MSSKEKLIERITPAELAAAKSLMHLREDILGQDPAGYNALRESAAKSIAQIAGQTISGFRGSYLGDFYKQLSAIQFQLLQGFKPPDISQHMGDIIRQITGPLVDNYRLSAKESLTQVIKSLSVPRADFTSAVEALGRAILRDSDLTRIRGNGVAAALAALQVEQDKGLESLRESFARIAAEALKERFESLDERDEKAFAKFEQLLEDKVAKLPKNKVSAEGLALLLQILSFLVSIGAWNTALNQERDAKQSSNVQAMQYAQLMTVFKQIAHNTEQLIPTHDQNIYYVVERKVDLKTKPKNNSATIATIFPNQKTRLVQMNHQWIYIEYFDYLESIPKYGWAKKKYLKRVE